MSIELNANFGEVGQDDLFNLHAAAPIDQFYGELTKSRTHTFERLDSIESLEDSSDNPRFGDHQQADLCETSSVSGNCGSGLPAHNAKNEIGQPNNFLSGQ